MVTYNSSEITVESPEETGVGNTTDVQTFSLLEGSNECKRDGCTNSRESGKEYCSKKCAQADNPEKYGLGN